MAAPLLRCLALQFGHSATELSTRTTFWVFGPISWNAPYSGVQLKATMRSNEQPLVLPPFTKLHLKFDPAADRHKSQSINSTEQNNNLHKNIIINTISHFSVSRKWVERVVSNFRNITFCEKSGKHSANQLSYVWRTHYCFSADSQVKSDSFAIFYNHNRLTYHQKDDRLRPTTAATGKAILFIHAWPALVLCSVVYTTQYPCIITHSNVQCCLNVFSNVWYV